MNDELTDEIVKKLWKSVLNNSDSKEKIPTAVAACRSMGTYLPNKLAIKFLSDLASGHRDFNSDWNIELSRAAAEAMAKTQR